MSLRENLIDVGWHLTQEGIDSVSENGKIQDVNIISKKALDCDLRDIGDVAFPEDFTKDPSKLEKPIIVQIQKIRNVSAPKANEESMSAPRMLKLTLHDGKTTCTGLEVSPIPSLSINTPPGTKVVLNNEGLEVVHGILCLTSNNISILGGKVAHMIEKWELNRSLAKHTRGGIGADGGPPPWIPFGQRLEAHSPDKQFKSLQEQSRQENAEFEAQRKGAIAEAQRLSGVKKVFGGGTKPLLDANVQKIVDAGFTEEQADQALRYTKNNVERALRVLHKQEHPERERAAPGKEAGRPRDAEPHGKRKGRHKEPADDDPLPVKPSGKVSLFDFLEDKLPGAPDRDRERERAPDRANHRDRSKPGAGRGGGGGGGGGSGGRHHAQDYHRDDRKYQPNEKPPRFQKKLDEKNKQQQQHQQQHQQQQVNNGSAPYNNSYHNQYSRGLPDKAPPPPPPHQQPYRGQAGGGVDALAEAAGALSLLPPPFRRANPPPAHPAPAYPDYPRRPHHHQPNGYMDHHHNMYPGVGYGYSGGGGGGGGGSGPAGGGGGGARAGPFLAGGLLGFQNAAVNEQARAMLGVADLAWAVGDRCLALYWEDNNFYEAEITGISQNTVVVKFCAYGNHEEILKSNCLPFPNQGSGAGAGAGYLGRGAGVYAARRV